MRRSVWLAIAFLVICLVWAGRQEVRTRAIWKPTLLVLAPPEAWEGITGEQRLGIGALFRDCLEWAGGVPLVDPEALLPTTGRTFDFLEIRGARTGDRLGLQVVWRRSGLQEERREGALEPPLEAFTSALGFVGLEGAKIHSLIPGDPQAFWTLAGLADWRLGAEAGATLSACSALAESQPGCAAAWLAKARVANLQLLTNPAWDMALQQACEADFTRALERAPGYPRALASFARFKSDLGNQLGALDLLLGALGREPRLPRLYEAVAYAARSAGLLEGARMALRERDLLTGSSRGEPDTTENTYLYLGDLEAFEALLGAGSEGEPDSMRDFYRGYTRLLRGDRVAAEALFLRAWRHPSGLQPFERLSEVFALGLQGRREPALEKLRAIWAARMPLKMPDGEYTFKVAEAFGFLESPGEAQEVATRAFSQGFGCTRWYQESPFLAGIRSTPRWNALQQHLQERQRFAERLFPVARFQF